MSIISKQYWESLEEQSATLFLVGFVLELVFALNHGFAYLMDSITFFDWIYPAVILGRLAVFFGLAGLSVGLIELHPRIGKLSRVLLGGAMIFAVGLIATSILQNLGVTTPIIAMFGIGTVVFTLLSFILFGIAGLRTDAFPTVVGGLMLVASVAILFVLLGSGTFSTNIRGAVGESLNAIAFLAIWYVLRSRSTTTTTAERMTDAPAE